MASVEQHLKQWRHNRKFAKSIPREFRDWQVNAIFYTALHLVDAALAKLGVAVSDHLSRNETVWTNLAFVTVRNSYLNLYRISVVTRYDANPDGWIPRQYASVNDLADDLLKAVENGLGAIIGKNIQYERLQLDA